MDIDMKNFNCIVTGGTGALGREVVAEFINKGATVFTNYRNEASREELNEYTGGSSNLFKYKADLTVEEQVSEFFQKFKMDHKRLDVFLHVMGGFWMGPDIADTPLERWDQMLKLNLLSTFLCSREAFKLMKAQCSGKIFTVSAKTALDLPAGMGAYAVSKAAVLSLTELLTKEGKPYNIQVNSILPSIIDTIANRNAMPDADHSNWVKPGDIARMLVHLSQPEVKVLSETFIKVYGKL